MGKILNTYGSFTAAQLKSRSSIPQQSSIVVNAGNIDCSNIIITDVKNVIGHSNANLGSLSESENVNKYSYFGPYSWSILSNNFTYNLKYPYKLGNFAGYNHNATIPSITAKNTNGMVTDFPATFNVTAFFQAGELDYSNIDSNIQYLWLKVYDDLTPVGENSVPIANVLNGSSNTLTTTFNYNYETDHTYNCKLYFGKANGELVAYYWGESQWSLPIKSYYLNPITWTFSIGSNWPETIIPTKLGETFIDRANTQYVLHYNLERIGVPAFTSNVVIQLNVKLYRDNNLIADANLPSYITTSGISDPQSFYASGYLKDLSGFPLSLNYGDNLAFTMNRISGGF